MKRSPPAHSQRDEPLSGGNALKEPFMTTCDVADNLERRMYHAPTLQVLETILRELFPGRTAVVSSFGADSAVLLHLVAAIDSATPVLFIDTGRHFLRTLEYRDRLVDHLGLRDVRSIRPTDEDTARFDPYSSRALWDPDGCCAFRKAAPLERALGNFGAWISGRKRYQAASRLDLQVFQADGRHVKINPLARWDATDIADYVVQHQLPRHPLVDQGYLSIGCEPCTSIVRPGENVRAGRWRGFDKIECGIHLPARPGRHITDSGLP
jgi:phosphoadenosine phosphosulfate reductase